ncbi:MAG: alpha/beta fold hydrolase [Chlamydiales bacterium]|nr:alpha/beta fold hydrolase [Chlamydiales bacterium]
MFKLAIFFLCLCIQTVNAAMQIPTETTTKATLVQSANFVIPDYLFRNGERLSNVKIHYYTLGTPKRNAQGDVINAVLLLHWTGASGQALLSEDFMSSLYAPGKPLDANNYFIIIPDNIGHGHSSKPSDGLHMRFPRYGYHDMVDLQFKLVTEQLGLKHLKMVIGTSMGGMHTWLWTELHPKFMDGAMPIVSLPAAVTGRNLLWRQAIVNAIKNDPKQGLLNTWPFARMLLDGIPHLHHEISNVNQSQQFISEAVEEASKKEPLDVLYVLDASHDYDPEPALGKIETIVYALDFSDDQLDPMGLAVLKTLIKRVKNGRAVIQEGNDSSFGHLTMAHPQLWEHQVKTFVSLLP